MENHPKRKVLLVHFNIGSTVGLNNGLTSISAMLKREGHTVKLLLLEKKSQLVEDVWSQVINPILEFEPDYIGLSLVETQKSYAFHFLEVLIPYKHGYIIVGGPFPTMHPEEVLAWVGVNAVCIGEGEWPMTMLVNEGNPGPFNIWVKGEPMPLIDKPQNLMLLPPEDKKLFPLEYVIAAKGNQLEASAGRGCAYSCSYCINRSYIEKYKLGPTVRMKNPTTVIEGEILPYVKDPRYKIERIAFIDDDFLMYERWDKMLFYSFLTEYKEKVHLPFNINTSPMTITRENLRAFKKFGGCGMRMGIESNQRLRKEVLHRPILDDTIYRVFSWAAAEGVEMSTYNMIGLPTETQDDVMELLGINATLKPKYVKLMTFYPFQGTPLYEMLAKVSMIDMQKHAVLDNYETESCLMFPADQHLWLRKVQAIFPWMLNVLMHTQSMDEYRMVNLYEERIKEVLDPSIDEHILEGLIESGTITQIDQMLSSKTKGPHYIRKSRSLAYLKED